MLLNGLAQYNRPLEIKFEEMLKLMDQCEHVDKLSFAAKHKSRYINDEGSERSSSAGSNNNNESGSSGVGNGSEASSSNQDGVALKLAANIFPRSPFSLLSGIIPGKMQEGKFNNESYSLLV